MSRAGYREMLRATFIDDWATAERLGEALGDVPWKDSGLLVAALFSLVVELRFDADNRSANTAREFVMEACEEYAEEGQLKQLYAEGVLRAALGDEDMLDGVPPLEGVQTQITLIHKILHDAEIGTDGIEELLDRAEALLDEAV